jgi:hypothetical protein
VNIGISGYRNADKGGSTAKILIKSQSPIIKKTKNIIFAIPDA